MIGRSRKIPWTVWYIILLPLCGKITYILCLLGCYSLHQLTALLPSPLSRSRGLLPRSQRQLPRPLGRRPRSWPRTLVPRSRGQVPWVVSLYRHTVVSLTYSTERPKGPFIATQLNSTQLNWPSWTAYSQVSHVFVYDVTTYKLSQPGHYVHW